MKPTAVKTDLSITTRLVKGPWFFLIPLFLKSMYISGISSHSRPVTGLQFSPDGLHLVSCGIDNKVRVWCTSTGKNTNLDISVPNSGIRNVQFAVSGTTPDLIFMPNGKSIDAIDICTGKRQYTLHGHFRNVNCCYYHPDYHELFTGGSDRNILVWTPKTGASVNYLYKKEVRTVKQEPLSVSNVTNSEQSVSLAVTADSWSSDEDT